MRKAAVVLGLALGLVAGAPQTAAAWGFEAHKFIMERAISLLPAEIRPFFQKYQTTLVEHAIDPDLWRVVGWVEESPHHFLDLDAYGPYPFKSLPHDYDQAVARQGRDFVERNGTLPWRVEEIDRKLVEAFTQKSAFSRENIKLFSSVIAHYIADAHVPFHAALNHDGQLSGQWGIHARFETELFDRYRSKLQLAPGGPAPVSNPREFVFDTLTVSYTFVQPILDADKIAVGSRSVYDDQYFETLYGRVKPILEKRLSDAITAVASMIAAAWNQAGRVAIPVEEPKTLRPVRRQ